MHGIKVPGTVEGTGAAAMASDCGGAAGIYRGDLYVDWLVKKIQASPLWTNTAKRVAIVLMFDEASRRRPASIPAADGIRAPGRTVAGQSLGPLVKTKNGDVVVDRVDRELQSR